MKLICVCMYGYQLHHQRRLATVAYPSYDKRSGRYKNILEKQQLGGICEHTCHDTKHNVTGKNYDTPPPPSTVHPNAALHDYDIHCHSLQQYKMLIHNGPTTGHRSNCDCLMQPLWRRKNGKANDCKHRPLVSMAVGTRSASFPSLRWQPC